MCTAFIMSNVLCALQDSVVDQLHELIFEYLNIHSHTIGFPELALPILMEVRLSCYVNELRM